MSRDYKARGGGASLTPNNDDEVRARRRLAAAERAQPPDSWIDSETARRHRLAFLALLFARLASAATIEFRMLALPRPGVRRGRITRRIWARDSEQAEIESWVASRLGENVLVGVHPRCGSGAGTTADLAELHWAFADLDVGDGKGWTSREDALASVAQFRPSPSAVVLSGTCGDDPGGVHAWYRLERPLELEHLSEWQDVQRMLGRRLRADGAGTNPTQALRLPGTLNLKPGRPVRRVRLLELRQEQCPAFEELGDLVDAEDRKQPARRRATIAGLVAGASADPESFYRARPALRVLAAVLGARGELVKPVEDALVLHSACPACGDVGTAWVTVRGAIKCWHRSCPLFHELGGRPWRDWLARGAR